MQAAAQPAMQSAIQPGSLSKKALWGGRIMSGLVTAFLLFDAVIHLLKPAPVSPRHIADSVLARLRMAQSPRIKAPGFRQNRIYV